MTDYCYTSIVAYGQVNAVRDLEKWLTPDGKEFSFDGLVPMPEDIFRGDLVSGSPEAESGVNWLAWRRSHWGTKWDCDDVHLKADYDANHGYLKVGFRNPWGPPFPIIELIVKSHCNLNFAMKFDPDIGTGEIEVCVTDTENGFGKVMEEQRILPDNGCGSIDSHFIAAEDFLVRWGSDSHLKRAMELLDYHDEQRLSASVHK